MDNKKRNNVTITIPSGLLESLYHIASSLESTQDLLSWLIKIFEGQNVEVNPYNNFDDLPEPPGEFYEMSPPDEPRDLRLAALLVIVYEGYCRIEVIV